MSVSNSGCASLTRLYRDNETDTVHESVAMVQANTYLKTISKYSGNTALQSPARWGLQVYFPVSRALLSMTNTALQIAQEGSEG